MHRIDELTRKDLYKDLDSRTKKKSKFVKNPKYIGITKDYVIIMKVPSVTANPPTEYTVLIKLIDYPLINDKDLSTEEKIRLSIDGDVQLSCTCPAWKYWGYDYIMTQLNSKEGNPQTIYPKVRNPKLEGTICKHAYIAIRGFGKWWKKIASDIDKGNFIVL